MFTKNVSNHLSIKTMCKNLGSVLAQFTDVEVSNSQQNYTTMPIGDFVTMTSLGFDEKSTNTVQYSAITGPASETHRRTLVWKVQIDCYGSGAADIANVLSTMWRTSKCCELFQEIDHSIVPMHGTSPLQTFFIDDSNNYSDRYTFTLYAQVAVATTFTA